MNAVPVMSFKFEAFQPPDGVYEMEKKLYNDHVGWASSTIFDTFLYLVQQSSLNVLRDYRPMKCRVMIRHH